MDVCGDILDKIEIQNGNYNNAIYDLVLQEFLRVVDIDFNFVNCKNAGEKVRSLKDRYIYTSRYVDLFFQILNKYGYNMRQEIKDAMFMLGHLIDPNVNQAVIKRLLNSPVIQDISFNGKREFLISSEQYGDFTFELASYYFGDNERMTDYIQRNELPNRCHIHAYFMSGVFKDFYSITSLCRSYFKDSYYHSYTYDKDSNVIIDLCSNAIVDKDLYYQLYQPKDISVILNSRVEEELALTRMKSFQYFDRCRLLKIALYKQYLNNIGYHGSLEKAPYAR